MNEEKRTRPLERFGWFAVSHVLISVLTLLFTILILSVGSGSVLEGTGGYVLLVGLELLSMAAYWGTGAYLARCRQCTAFSGPKEFWGAMLRPAVIAWIWGGVALGAYADFANLPPDEVLPTSAVWGVYVGVLFCATLLLCAPSVLLAMLWLLIGFARIWLGWSLAVLLFLAGGLPPLLFTLGSAWGSAEQERDRIWPLLTGAVLVATLGLALIGRTVC